MTIKLFNETELDAGLDTKLDAESNALTEQMKYKIFILPKPSWISVSDVSLCKILGSNLRYVICFLLNSRLRLIKNVL